MGLVSMMDGYLCPHCGRMNHQLLSPQLGEPNAYNGQHARLLRLHITSYDVVYGLSWKNDRSKQGHFAARI